MPHQNLAELNYIKEEQAWDDAKMAKMLNLSILIVQEMARKREIIGRKIKRKWRFHPDAYKNYLLKK